MKVQLTSIVATVLVGLSFGADGPTTGRREAQAALKAYGGLVGDWKGTGQVQRNKVQGAWSETANWAWKLSAQTAALELKMTKGKYFQSAVLRPGQAKDSFELEATLVDGGKRTFNGKGIEGKPLVLNTSGSTGLGPRRVTLTLLHESRLLMLYEAKSDGGGQFYRLGEVGLTKQGVAFAAGESYPLCIVTQGRGTTQVTYKGKSYWVCCSGCKDLFNENPDAILAEAAKSKK